MAKKETQTERLARLTYEQVQAVRKDMVTKDELAEQLEHLATKDDLAETSRDTIAAVEALFERHRRRGDDENTELDALRRRVERLEKHERLGK